MGDKTEASGGRRSRRKEPNRKAVSISVSGSPLAGERDRARAGVDHRSGDVGRSAYYRPGSVPSRLRPPGSADVRWPPAGWSSRSGRNEGKWSYPRGSGEPDRSRTGVSVKEAVVVVLR